MREFGKDDDLIVLASADVKVRFYSRVHKRDDGCWLYQRHGKTGYAYFQWAKNKSSPAHRVSLLWSSKSYVSKMYACHTCTRKNCVNPLHLYWGTAKENLADCIRSGDFKRSRARGASCKFSFLDEQQVLSIASLCQSTSLSYPKIGRRFGVSGQCVRFIDKKKTWEHLERPNSNRARPGPVTPGKASSIVLSLRNGKTVPEAAAQHGVTVDVAGNIARGKTWTSISGGVIKTVDGRTRPIRS